MSYLEEIEAEADRRKRGILIDFPPLTEEQLHSCSTESEKARELYWRYTLKDGLPAVGIDLASGGRPCVPWGLNFDLPVEHYAYYNSGQRPREPLHLRGFADQNLPFESDSFAWVFSSHFIEDNLYEDWPRLFREWSRIVQHGGYLIVLAPDKERWNWAITNLGQCPNNSHKYEPKEGDMGAVARAIGLEVIEDRLTNQYPHDYGLLGVFRKP